MGTRRIITSSVRTKLRVPNEVWIAAALLHRENPQDLDFTVDQIVQRVKKEGLSKPFRPVVHAYVVRHCVANRPASPRRYRMLFESAPGRRRLFRQGDSSHSQRESGKIVPAREDLPRPYQGLIAWYEKWDSVSAAEATETDSLLSLLGSGKDLWTDEHADDYVRRLRR